MAAREAHNLEVAGSIPASATRSTDCQALNTSFVINADAVHANGRYICILSMIMDFYNSAAWKRKRAAILRRDGYMCQRCKRYGRQRQAQTVHHIKHLDEYPELAYDSTNLISLCNDCHNAEHPEKAEKVNKSRKQTYY